MHCIAPHCTALYYTALHYTALNYTALHCTILHITALHFSAALFCAASHLHYGCVSMGAAGNRASSTALHCTKMHWDTLHSTALHCTALHCTALHCSTTQPTDLKAHTVPVVGQRGVLPLPVFQESHSCNRGKFYIEFMLIYVSMVRRESSFHFFFNLCIFVCIYLNLMRLCEYCNYIFYNWNVLY